MQNDTIDFRAFWHLAKNVNIYLLHDLDFSLLDTYPREKKGHKYLDMNAHNSFICISQKKKKKGNNAYIHQQVDI